MNRSSTPPKAPTTKASTNVHKPLFRISPASPKETCPIIRRSSLLSSPAMLIAFAVTTSDVAALASSMQAVSFESGTRFVTVAASCQLAASSQAPSAPIQLIVHGPSANTAGAMISNDGSTSAALSAPVSHCRW